MHLTIITGGSQGDVQPLVALAAGLRRAGHRVRFATHPLFEEFVARRGLEFFSLGGNDPRGVMAAEQRRQKRKLNAGRLGSLWRVLRRTPPSAGDLRPIQDACLDTDAVIYSPQSGLANVASHVAERLRLPAFAAYLYPSVATRDFPSPHAPPGRSLGPAYNRLTHVASRNIFQLAGRGWVNRWRVEALRLPPLSLKSVLREGRVPQLHAFSPAVIPRPRDWGEWQHVTGYWFLDDEGEWDAPDGLREFLRAGEPPVYVGFGSMVDPRPSELSEIVSEALALCGRRAVVGEGWGGLRCEAAGIYRVGWVSYPWLLARVAAAVHHAGTGTAAETLRAGVPSVAVPFFGEQRFWAARLHALGVAPAPIRRAAVTAERLAAAIDAAAGDASVRARAESLGATIRNEDGVAEAVKVIDHYLSRGREGARAARA
jgi:sterol 3beta-glucosyltransferase